METTSRDTPPGTAVASVVGLCAPTILGGIVVITARVLYPDGLIPAETLTGRVLVYVFSLGALIGALGIPLAIVGFCVGAVVLRKVGPTSTIGMALLVTIAASIAAGVHLVTVILEGIDRYRSVLGR